jgi:ubiquinone/menaquinone biosynthesis C-methylase UbiE
MVKLNLACGTDIKDPPWVNLDIVKKWPSARRECDVVWDARKDPIPFADESVDEVYAGYLLLHIPRRFHWPVLTEIRRVLRTGGLLMVGEVDMRLVFERYLKEPHNPSLSELIWGEQGTVHGAEFTEFDTHVQGYTQDTLETLLRLSRFRAIERTNIHVAEVWYELTLMARK